MKFGAINFPRSLLDALREKRLVVFAGAGVSMGPPAWLPSFPDLAKQIAKGGIARELNPAILDLELGDLERAGVQVHRLCREIIQGGPPNANDLHKSLLQMFGDIDAVRIVTSNYDCHFTRAAMDLWQRAPTVFDAPALPLGSGFKGIVHVHGTDREGSSMVLTDSDFGRAYLIDGWARRFLLDVFTNYAVLFVGYSHSETVMRYMARALPPGRTKDRFALIHADDSTESWKSLGITPVQFPSRDGNRYIELSHGVATLAAAENRGVLDLQADIGKIAAAAPPNDPATEDQVLDAISKAHTLRFFAQNAKPALWLQWLDDRGLLDPLFRPERLDEAGFELAKWALGDALDDSTALMAVAGKHDLEFNRRVWMQLASNLAHSTRDGRPAPPKFGRWLTLLLERPPKHPDPFTMLTLAATAAKQDDMGGALAIFEMMTRSEINLSTDRWPGVDGVAGTSSVDMRLVIKASAHYNQKIWKSIIAPRLQDIHASALTVCVEALETRIALRRRWEPGRDAWDWDSGSRTGIDAHPQDRFTGQLTPLVDGARDCLEWIAHRAPHELHAWVSRLWAYRSLLVKRLAVHAVRISPQTDNDKLVWLFGVGGQDLQLKHEVYALLKQCYPNASPDIRAQTMTWVASFDAPGHVEEAHRADARDSWMLEVLWWLKKSVPDCELVKASLMPLEARHPEWAAAQQPDILVTHSRRPAGLRPSPVTVDELLHKPAADWIHLFMTFERDSFLGPDRDGLWLAAQEAAKLDEAWQRDLLTALQAHWESPIWSTLIAGWGTWPDDANAAAERLQWLRRPEMLKHHATTASHVLRSLVAGSVKPYVASLIPLADEICRGLCASLETDPVGYEGTGWLDAAINRPAGALADYVGDSLALRSNAGDASSPGLDADAEALFAQLLRMKNGHAMFVRPVIARRLVQLAEIALEWTQATIVPWLSSPDDECFAQAWDGFLLGGRFSVDVVEMVKPAFLAGTQRLANLLPGRLDDYIEIYIVFMLMSADPLADWIPHLAQNSGDDARKMFAWRMHWHLSQEPAARGAAWWHAWLRTYWERRLKGMPKPLAGGELGDMLGWPAVLPEVYAEAVNLAAAMPKGQLEYTSVFEDMVERKLHWREPEATAIYLTTMLGWPGGDHLLYELPDVIKDMDRSKISAATLHALDEALAMRGLQGVQWGPAGNID